MLKTGGGGGEDSTDDSDGDGSGYTLLAMNVDAAGSIIGRFTFPSVALQGLAVMPLFEEGKRALRVMLDNETGTASFEDLFEGFGTHVYRISKPTNG